MVNEDAGPYSISIWTDPNPLRADETHVVVAVVDPRTREPIVNDVGVAVRMRSVSDPTHEIVRQAPTDQTNRLLYAAEFTDLVAPGAWEVGVTASGPAGTTREVKFLVEITNASQPSYFLIGAAVMGGIVTIWLVTSARTSRKAPHIAAH